MVGCSHICTAARRNGHLAPLLLYCTWCVGTYFLCWSRQHIDDTPQAVLYPLHLGYSMKCLRASVTAVICNLLFSAYSVREHEVPNVLLILLY